MLIIKSDSFPLVRNGCVSDNNVIGMARCEFDGELSPNVVVVGYQRENLANWTEREERPIVFFMQQNRVEKWQKVGPDQLFAIRDYYPLNSMIYTHLHVGGDISTGGPASCNCEKFWRMQYGTV
jgi:hypothetical protein